MTPLQIFDVGIDPGTSGGIAALDREGHVVMLCDTPTAALGAGGKKIVDAGAVARLLLDLAGAHMGLIAATTEIKPAPPSARLRVWIERVGPGKGEGVSSVFTFGGAFRAVHAAVEALAIARPEVFVLHPDAVASGRSAATMIESAAWARSAGLPPNKDREARLKRYHAEACKRWPDLDKRATKRNVVALLGPRGGANYNKAAALWIADHGRRLAQIGGSP